MSKAQLDLAVAAIRAGRSPAPPPDRVFVGDGDFRAIGAEFLGYFVEVGGLTPQARVLDVGCGIGRMAAALAPYLGPTGSYLGIDPVPDGIAWCRAAFAAHPNFAFEHLDVENELYNPGGSVSPETMRLPADDRSVDFVILTSVLTHLRTAEAAHTLSEVGRVLAPGGRLFATAYLFEGARPPAPADPFPAHLRFSEPSAEDAERWHVADLPPLAAVAFRAEPFLTRAAGALGRPVELRPGRWRGGPGPWFQDLVLA